MNWGDSTNHDSEVIVLLLAGPAQRITAWSQHFQMDSAFRVNTFATDPQDLQLKLATNNPDAVLIDARIFSGPDQLMTFLTRVQGAAYILLPPGVAEDKLAAVRALPAVKNIFIGDVNLLDLTTRMKADVSALRLQAPALNRPNWNNERQGNALGGLRVISVWNRVGGAGKTTLAAALALDAAQRGLRTLLVGLATPDASLPTLLNLKTSPNLSTWLARPSYEDGLLPAVQKVGGLDVIVGLQDILREKDLLQKPEEPSSINALAIAATFGGYSVGIFDTPCAVVFPAAISASNTLVLVANPMVDHALATAEAYRVVFKKMSGQHRVGLGNVYVALNRHRSGLPGANEWHEAASAFARSVELATFPPVAAVIPDVPEVQMAANAGRSPLTASEKFAAPVHRLGDALFGSASSGSFQEETRSRSFLGIRLVTKGSNG